jgi:hypothetical protein
LGVSATAFSKVVTTKNSKLNEEKMKPSRTQRQAGRQFAKAVEDPFFPYRPQKGFQRCKDKICKTITCCKNKIHQAEALSEDTRIRSST